MLRTNPDMGAVSLVYVVGRVNQGIRRALQAVLSEWALSVPEFTALSILEQRPGLSNAQLARRTMVAPQSMIEILAKLEERGLVGREIDPDHGRILRARLTPAGEELVELVGPAVDQIQDEMLAEVPEAQRHVVLDGMLKAMERLRSGLDGSVTPGGAAARRSP